MDAAAIVTTIAGFLGLHVDQEVLHAAGRSDCAPSSSRRQQSFVRRSPLAPDDLAAVAPTLEWLFEPYNGLYRELAGESFVWEGSEHHTLSQLDAATKAKRAAELDAIIKKRTARIARQKDERTRRNREVREYRRRHQVTTPGPSGRQVPQQHPRDRARVHTHSKGRGRTQQRSTMR